MEDIHIFAVLRIFAILWLVHAVIAAVFVFPIALFGRRRVRWYGWELLALVLPFCVWCMLYCFWPASPGTKGIGNIGEPVFVSIAIVLAALVRVVSGQGREADQRLLAAIILAVQCAMAAIIYFATPDLGGSLG